MAKPVKRGKILKPAMLTLAAMAGWAALHEPNQMSIANVGVWICGACTVALLTSAGLALVTPLLAIMGIVFGRAVKTLQHPGADS